jgi:hypothetical protein
MIFFMKVNNKLVTKGSKYHKFSHLFGWPCVGVLGWKRITFYLMRRVQY